MSTTKTSFIDDDYCFACGKRNPFGLHLSFYEEGGGLCTDVTPSPHWQGFSGVMHGGLQSTVLDDLMSNHLFRLERVWVVTGELKVRYHGPVPLDHDLTFSSKVTERKGRIWLMEGACRLKGDTTGKALTTGSGRFVEVPHPA